MAPGMELSESGRAGARAAAVAPESVLFPVGYSWLVLAGSLDVIMTHLMLNLGAIEVNVVADHAIRAGGLWGLIALKFLALAVVLGICEFVGRRRMSTARSWARACCSISRRWRSRWPSWSTSPTIGSMHSCTDERA
ncbi:MAG TPA: DUF5658 family protein [Phycisphaerales bacterium]|nr:DUF5658 family protein [Phycisphaerales bacterium]